jgi:hypothetical protein
MLEHSSLLIRRNGMAWDIVEPDSGRPLGYARVHPPRSTWWLGWLKRGAVDVYEVEDEPLVFTLRRLWGFSARWEICEADGHRVALVRLGRILDAFGQPWAMIESTPDGVHFRAGDREFAHAQQSSAGVQIHFASELQDHPLTKMSLLGAVIAMNNG